MRRVLVIVVMTQAFVLICHHSSYAAPAATVIGLSGKVEIASSGADRWGAAKVNQSLDQNDRIKTGGKSGAVLLFDGGSRMKLGPFTILTISARDGSQPSGGVALDLTSGKVWAKVNKLNNPNDGRFEIKTPVAVTGVRGTEFALDVDDDGTTILTVVEGNTSFGNEFGGVVVGASQQSTAEPGKAPTPPKVVDTRHWIEWTFDIRAMGTDFETPFHGGDKKELASIRQRLEEDIQDDDTCEKRIELAGVLYDLGLFNEAGEYFGECLDDDDYALDAAYGMGKVKLAGGDTAAAALLFNGILESLEKAEEEESDKGGETTYEVVRQTDMAVTDDKKMHRSGLSTFRQVKNSTSEDSSDKNRYDDETIRTYRTKAYFGLGLVALKERKFEEAKTSFGKALDFFEGACLPNVGMATALMNMGDTDGAMEFTGAALDEEAGCYQAMTLKSLLELAGNKPDAALEDAAKAVEAAPWSADAHAALARIRFFRGEFDAARSAADDTLALAPSNPAAHEILARLLLSEGNYQDAIREALLCLALDEDNPYANDDLAMIYYLYREYAGAILHWKKAIAADPRFSVAKVRLARLYNDLEEKDTAREAEKLARDVTDTEKENDAAWEELGRALEMLGKYEEAEAAFLEALRIAPNNASHLSRIASFYVARHKTDLAVFYAQKAVAAQPANPWNHFILGRAYEAVDQTAAAKAAYINAIYLDPDFSLARYQLGVILGSENNAWDALTDMHSAALEKPRIVTLAEYRGASRVYGTAGSHDSRYFEGVHTGDGKDYKLNYRAVITDSSTNGHREINGDEDKTGGSLLVGWQQNADSSLVLYGDISHDDMGVPGPATGSVRANDPDDRDKFKSGKYELSYRRRYGPKFALTLRAGKGMTSQEEFVSNDVDLVTTRDETEDRNTELEFRGESRPNDRTQIVFGAFSSKSKFSETNYYEDVFGGEETSDDSSFKQKNLYLRAWHSPSNKLRLNAGVEKSDHNIAGSRSLPRFGFDYKLNERSWIRFISRDYFRMSFHPRYQPADEWVSTGEMDDSPFGTKTRHRELSYETRLPDGTFIKAAGYGSKSWGYDPNTDFRTVDSVAKSDGYTIDCEKPVSRKASVFVAVAGNTTREKTPGSVYYGNRVPYTDTSRASVGLYLFPNSFTTIKIIGDQYGKRYINTTNTLELPSYQLMHLQLRYDPAIDKSYMFTVRNLFDKKYELEKNYPEAGRTYEFSLIRWF